jgi:riboflavin-specific deaminase-like protein
VHCGDDAGMADESELDCEPEDWPALWEQILRARAARTVPAQAQTAAGAARLALYQPLLHARRAPDGAAPWVLAQLGQSLDGCIATAGGDSYFVTGPQSLLHLHRLRALCDAVIVGAGTVAADDPQLTTRRVPGPHAQRVVLDPGARLDGRARVFRDGRAPTLWLCDARHAERARQRLGAGAAEVLALPGLLDDAGALRRDHPVRVVQALGARGLRVLLVEGGGVTVSRFLDAGALHRLHLVIAPVLIGDGRRGLQGPARATMADCLRPTARRLALGEDMLWDLALHADFEAGG